ncbi:MAG TPA: hypothetical protein VED66_16475 [Candidatus Sulfotelmatobacter sp.]|nr:hypothetical protein [Candidatus Sulfotelmatobacter sp.]
MSVYTPHWAPIVALAFMGTGFVLVVGLFVVLFGVLRKSRGIVLGGLAGVLTTLLAYGTVLLSLSLLSSNVELPQGAWKYFCEIDCHLAYAIGGAQVVGSAGPEIQALTPDGKFVIVQVKTWFDPSTISAHRGNGPLVPNERKVVLVDRGGRTFAQSSKSEAVLAAEGLHATSLGTALRPGESYISYLVFEVPGDSRGLRLLIISADEVGRMLWGHESSPFHKKAYFALPAA